MEIENVPTQRQTKQTKQLIELFQFPNQCGN